MRLHCENMKAYCLRNEINVGDWLWSACWNNDYRAAKRVTGFGESCVVMRRPRAMEHVVTEAPIDIRKATADEIQREKSSA